MVDRTVSPTGFRPDIDGMRALAVVFVLLFHADVPGFGGGFSGVDVFFVISGFLITQRLLDEMSTTGRIAIGRFWLGRLRRLVPAAATMIVVVLPATLLVQSPFLWKDRTNEALASAAYVANVYFGAQPGSYFGRTLESSPFLHMWSLAVEEQFYLAWPALLAAVALATTARRRRAAVGLVLIGICLVSFVASIGDVGGGAAAYYHPGLRVWQLGAGGLLAATWPVLAPITTSPAIGRAARLVGLTTLAIGVAVVEPGVGYPDVTALVPVAASILLVVASGDRSAMHRLMAAPPVQWLGRLSYSLYLWHYPVIVLGRQAAQRWFDLELGWPALLALGVAGAGPAVLSRRFVEEPIRRAPALVASGRRTLAATGAVVAGSLVVVGAAFLVAERRLDEPELLALQAARSDYPPIPDVCATTDPDILLDQCTDRSDGSSGRSMLLVGDSHMANWAPSLRSAALDTGVDVTAAMGGGCPVIGDGIVDEPPWCTDLRSGLVAAVDALSPDVVVVSHSSGYPGLLVDDNGRVVDGDDQVDAWGRALDRLLVDLTARPVDVVVIQPTPRHRWHPIECASVTADPSRCVLTRDEAVASVAEIVDVQRDVVDRFPDVVLIDPVDLLCDDERCRFEHNGHHVWNDEHHITPSYAVTLAPEFEALVARS